MSLEIYRIQSRLIGLKRAHLIGLWPTKDRLQDWLGVRCAIFIVGCEAALQADVDNWNLVPPEASIAVKTSAQYLLQDQPLFYASLKFISGVTCEVQLVLWSLMPPMKVVFNSFAH
eukprot:749048-Amphidinium_carterae.1